MQGELPQPVTSAAPETAPPPDLGFITPDFVQDLRAEQRQLASDDGITIPSVGSPDLSDPDRQRTFRAAQHHIKDYNRHFLTQHVNSQANPILFEEVASILDKYSVFAMDDVKWDKGDGDNEAHAFKPGTAGKHRLQDEVEQLDTRPPNERLAEVRKQLAELSVQRRRKIWEGGKKNQRLHDEYGRLALVYQQYQQLIGQARVSALHQEGHNPQEIQQSVVASVIEEHHAFTETEFAVLQQDTSLRGRAARFLARSNRRFFATTFLSGAAVGFASHRLLGAAGIAVGVGSGAGLGIGLGLATTRAALTSLVGVRKAQITEHTKRYSEDVQALQERTSESISQHSSGTPSVADAHALLGDALNHSYHIQHDRILADQKSNQRRLGKAALFGALGGTLGALAGVLTDHINFGGNGEPSADPPSAPETTTPAEPPSGDTTPPPPDNEPTPPPSPPEQPPASQEYARTVTINQGEGITHGLQDLAQSAGTSLSAEESYQLYEVLENNVEGDFFANSDTYLMSNGDYGVPQAGSYRWDPAVIAEMERWLAENKQT